MLVRESSAPLSSFPISPSPTTSPTIVPTIVQSREFSSHVTSPIELPKISDCEFLKQDDNVLLAMQDGSFIEYFMSNPRQEPIFDFQNFTKAFNEYCIEKSLPDQNFLDFLKNSLLLRNLPGIEVNIDGVCKINVDKDSFNQTKIEKFVSYLSTLSESPQLDEKQKNDYKEIANLFAKVTNSSLENKGMLCPPSGKKDDSIFITTMSVIGGLGICAIFGYAIHKIRQNQKRQRIANDQVMSGAHIVGDFTRLGPADGSGR